MFSLKNNTDRSSLIKLYTNPQFKSNNFKILNKSKRKLSNLNSKNISFKEQEDLNVQKTMNKFEFNIKNKKFPLIECFNNKTANNNFNHQNLNNKTNKTVYNSSFNGSFKNSDKYSKNNNFILFKSKSKQKINLTETDINIIPLQKKEQLLIPHSNKNTENQLLNNNNDIHLSKTNIIPNKQCSLTASEFNLLSPAYSQKVTANTNLRNLKQINKLNLNNNSNNNPHILNRLYKNASNILKKSKTAKKFDSINIYPDNNITEVSKNVSKRNLLECNYLINSESTTHIAPLSLEDEIFTEPETNNKNNNLIKISNFKTKDNLLVSKDKNYSTKASKNDDLKYSMPEIESLEDMHFAYVNFNIQNKKIKEKFEIEKEELEYFDEKGTDPYINTVLLLKYELDV